MRDEEFSFEKIIEEPLMEQETKIGELRRELAATENDLYLAGVDSAKLRETLAAAERDRDELRTKLERAADMLQDSRNAIQALTLSRDPVCTRAADQDAAWTKATERARRTLHGIDSFEPLTSVTRRAKEAERERDELRGKLAEAEAACAEMKKAIRKVLDYFDGIDRSLDFRYKLKETPGSVSSYQYLQDTLNSALSPSAGRDLLERVKEMEGLLSRVLSDGDPCDKCTVPRSDCGGICFKKVTYESIDAYLKRGEQDD